MFLIKYTSVVVIPMTMSMRCDSVILRNVDIKAHCHVTICYSGHVMMVCYDTITTDLVQDKSFSWIPCVLARPCQ